MAIEHYYEQIKHTEEYLIPYFEKNIPDFWNKTMLEVGCAEGGFIEILRKRGVEVKGVEISAGRVDIAHEKNPELDVIVGDITDDNMFTLIPKKYDIIVLRDVIEHIPDKLKALQNINKLLNDGGFVFISFPPFYSAYAGHQQNGKVFKFMPWIHFLPNFLINTLGNIFGEKKDLVEDVILNSKLGFSISSFENKFKKAGFKVIIPDLFLFRPIFRIRYGTKITKFPNIPLLREFGSMGCEYLLVKK